ncbi:DUF4893 domain-containing protein [Pseudaestuariivita atlantica]|uniref:DUF4893 domain-containing protein n=1 Tax=Pseudaestuariivita atlantica TaxID=1317121 RepID=A0A0L1JU45_9RHOB|nr:DUF4893 domain-containing protein [Pseudaestuariivita atlantica]KNG95212.1 hypothetical protein ATO11_00790 [Pseudaestuariivita atlantica]
MIRATCLALACLATPALAQDLRPADIPRYERNDLLLGNALRGALNNGAPSDVALLVEAMRGGPGPVSPVGDWKCRTMKLGDILPLVVYGNFRCRITEVERGHWRLEKLTGSQRTSGDLWETEGAVEYYGVGYVLNGPSASYDTLPPESQEPVNPGQTVAVIGFFEQMGENRARLLQPDPILESDYDILYLTR